MRKLLLPPLPSAYFGHNWTRQTSDSLSCLVSKSLPTKKLPAWLRREYLRKHIWEVGWAAAGNSQTCSIAIQHLDTSFVE